jgi:hypothetical protein
MMNLRKNILVVLVIGFGIIVWNGSVLAEQYYSLPGGRDILIVFDASGSMGDIISSGETKIDVAKKAVDGFLDGLASSDRVGLIVFYDCDNIQTKVHFTKNHDSVSTALKYVYPDGGTPIADSLTYAWNYLKQNANSGNSWYIILFTDGKDTCGGIPCSVARSISQEFDTYREAPVFAVGFFINSNPEGEKELQCIAQTTGGKYLPASSADRLGDVFKKIWREIEIGSGYLCLKVISLIAGIILITVVISKVKKKRFGEGKYIDTWTIVHFLVGVILGVILHYFTNFDLTESFLIAAFLLILWEKIEPIFWPRWNETLENQICDVIFGLIGFFIGYLLDFTSLLSYLIFLLIYSILLYKVDEKSIHQGISKKGGTVTCKIKCTLKGDNPEKTTKELMQKAKQYGFMFRGDTNKGIFEYKGVITARGKYSRSGKNFTVEVTNKPSYISCSRIAKEMNEKFSLYLSCKEK